MPDAAAEHVVADWLGLKKYSWVTQPPLPLLALPESESELEEIDNYCGICKGDFVEETELDGCNHPFCFECIALYSKQSHDCPKCKKPFTEFYLLDDKYMIPLEEIREYPSIAESSGMNVDFPEDDEADKTFKDPELKRIERHERAQVVAQHGSDAPRKKRKSSKPSKPKPPKKPKREGPLVCDFDGCGKEFKRKADFDRHVASHSDVRAFKCNHCDKAYKLKGELSRHEKTHSNIQFSCTICDASFTLRNNLSRHMTTKHKGVKSTCEECGATFSQASDLKRHMRVHTDERPFQCSKCPLRFKQKAHMQAHEKMHQGSESESSESSSRSDGEDSSDQESSSSDQNSSSGSDAESDSE
eukprot:TRINITY_DN2672_c5_g1_i2.p1 TRINITY_DN2672_c5_g1~~TRINITY_DN2672_c5_g1_i2.p1  ORF type:complete len:358 (+),score=57.63 TRINITY_DN2672_c5_g1_i2:3-1076(+)